MGSKSNSSNSTTNNVTNYSLQGMESAQTVVAGDNNTVTTTDHGAIEGAVGLGESALELGLEVVSSNQELATQAITSNSQLATETVGFAENAIETGMEFSKDVIAQTIASNQSSTSAISDLTAALVGDGSLNVTGESNKLIYASVILVVVVLVLFLMVRKK